MTLSLVIVLIIISPIILTILVSLIVRWRLDSILNISNSVPIHNEPPDNLSPAEIGAIFDYATGPEEMFATLYDLVYRKYIKVQTIYDDDAKYVQDLLITAGERPVDNELQLHESLLIKAFIYSMDDSQDTLIKNLSAYHAISTIFPLALQAVLEKKGYYQKSKFYPILIIISFVLAVLTLIIFPPLAVPIIVCPLLFVLIVGNRIVSTPKVRANSLLLKGFKRYILTVGIDRSKFHAVLSSNTQVLEREFAYVVAFKADRTWQKSFDKILQKSAATTKSNNVNVLQYAIKSTSLQQQFVLDIDQYKKSKIN